MDKNYTTVTETPDVKATREQISMLYTRYKFALPFCENRDVLEVGCGIGPGLGFLAQKGKQVTGGDYTESLLKQAHHYYKERIALLCLDGQALPFRNKTFEVIILFEAIYYFDDPDRFLEECRRILKPNGVLLICTANKEWPGFNPSPFSKRYFSAEELKVLLNKHQFETDIYGAFPISNGSGKDHFLSLIRKIAVSLNLIPKTMKGKEFLKRIFLGRLVPFPAELFPGISEFQLPEPITVQSNVSNFKILYAVSYLK